MEDILGLIESLENELAGAKKAVFSHQSLVDTQRCLELISAIKSNLPVAIKQASEVVQYKDNFIKDAEAKAQMILREADMRAEEIVSDSEILKRAEAEAETIKAEAKQFNDTIKQNAKIYVDDMFVDLEHFLSDSLATVRNNREELRGSIIKDKK